MILLILKICYNGIKSIVPFKCRGSKIIEDMQEAYIAASNLQNI